MSNEHEEISETRKKINQLYEENELQSLLDNRNRSRSISIGSAGGGVIEFSMRNEWANLYYLANPVEAIEILGELASACGVEIAMRPRNDFASWRSWDTELPGSIHWMGAAPWQLSDEDRKAISESKSKESQNKNSLPDMIDGQFEKKNIESGDDN
tara:strand:- start:3121 stop:3588 length:468 start_codon:yes stop_codon:yes gene_type:complete